MKRHIKLLLILIGLLFVPGLVSAKEIDTITVKGIVPPVGKEVPDVNAYIDTEGLTTGIVQWQTSNGGVVDDFFAEGTTYELYIDFEVAEGYEIVDNPTIVADCEYLETEYYGSGWIGLIYKSPGASVTHTVTFETNGGTKIDPIEVEDNDSVVKPTDPEKEGYLFDGWYTDSSFTEEYDFSNRVKEDKTLYAKWILVAAIKQINSIKVLGVETTIGGVVASTTAFIDTEGLTTTVAQWETTNAHVLGSNEKFEKDKQYCLYIGFNVADYYEVNDSATISANIEPDSYELSGSGLTLCYTVNKEVEIPFELNTTSIGEKNIKLSWNKKIDAKGYIVYQSTNNKKWKKIATIKNNSTLTYNVKKLSAGTKYYFKVEAYKVVKKKNKTIDTTKVIVKTTKPGIPKLKVKSSSHNSVKINIGKVKGATRYIIERSTDKKNYLKIDEITTAGNYKDEIVETGTKYYYRVKACNENCGKYSKVVNVKPSLKKPGIKVTAGKKKATVKLTGVSGASGYIVERSTKKNKGYEILYVATSAEYPFEDIYVKSKITYYYKVKAYKIVGDKTVFSGYSKVKSAKVK